MGSKLKLPLSVEFGHYKGFILKVDPLDDNYNEFVGVAINEEHTARLDATGKTRNECGKKLQEYVDLYRRDERKQKIIIN